MGLFDGSTTTSNSYSPEVTNFVNTTLAQVGNYTNGMTPANSVAGLTDDQKSAFQLARSSTGAWKNPLEQTRNLFTTAGGRGQAGVNAYSAAMPALQNWSAAGYQGLVDGTAGVNARLDGVSAPIDTAATDYSKFGTDAYGAAGKAYGMLNDAASTADLALNKADITGVTAGSVGGTDLSTYTDPYARQVLGTTVDEINRQAGIDANAARVRAAGSGGTGGAGSTLMQSQIARGASDATARASAQIMSDAYKNAQATAAADLDRKLAADTTTAQAQNTESLQRRQNALEVAAAKTAAASATGNVAAQQGNIAKNLSDTAQTEAQRRTSTELALRENQLKAAGIDVDLLKAKAAAGDAAADNMLQIIEGQQGSLQQAAGIENAAGAGLMTSAEKGQQLSLNDIQALLGIGQVQQQQTQSELNVPKDAINMRLAAVSGQPLNTSGTTPGGNTLAGALGSGAALIGGLKYLFGK